MTVNTNDVTQRRVNEALDRDVAQLDEWTLAKLKAARLNAMAQAATPRSKWRPLSWPQGMMASGVGLALVMMAVVNLNPESSPAGISEQQLLAAMNPVLSEDMDLLEQLEFVAWLEQENLVNIDGGS